MKYGSEQSRSLSRMLSQLDTAHMRPVCQRIARCEGCPCASYAYFCWEIDGICLRTLMEKIEEREAKHK